MIMIGLSIKMKIIGAINCEQEDVDEISYSEFDCLDEY